MEIENVHVSGFKAIDEIEFEPGQITLVTGPNNSGKTSLLEAIRLGFNPNSISEYRRYPAKIVREQSERSTVKIESRQGNRFKTTVSVPGNGENIQQIGDEISKTLAANPERFVHSSSDPQDDLELQPPTELANIIRQSVRAAFSEHIEEATKVASSRVVELESNDQTITHVGKKGLESALSDELVEAIGTKIATGLDLPMETISSPRIPTFAGTIQIVEAENESARSVELIRDRNVPRQIKENGEDDTAVRLSAIRDVLNELRDGDRIDTLSFDQIVFDGENGRYQVPYDYTGDGFQAMVELLWRLFDTEDLPEVLLLEEPDTHMHPEYVRQLVQQLTDFVRREDIQLFVTTHDIDLIRSFFDAVDPQQQKFLEEDFKLLKMNQELPEIYDYEQAREVAMEMQIDLRGR